MEVMVVVRSVVWVVGSEELEEMVLRRVVYPAGWSVVGLEEIWSSVENTEGEAMMLTIVDDGCGF